MKRNRILLIVTVLALTFALAAMAQGRGPIGGGGQGPAAGQPAFGQQGQFGGEQFLVRYLALTETQIAQWQAIREAARAKAAPLIESRKANFTKLQELLAVNPPNPTEIGNVVIANHAIGAQLRAIHEDAQAQFVLLLTTEQKAKYDQWLDLLKSMPRRGPGGQGDGPGAGMGAGFGFGPGDGSCDD